MVLAGVMIFICAGVVLRYVFNAPIVGANEVIEMGSVALVMLALPYCTTQESHVRIDLLDNVLGSLGRSLTDALYCVLAIAILWALTRSYLGRALDAWEFEDTTNMLGMAIWPFYALVAFGMATYGLILTAQLVRLVWPNWALSA